MSKKLDKHHLLLLQAIRSLEQELGVGEHYHVWSIMDRAFDISEELQKVEDLRNERRADERRRLQEEARGGDKLAREVYRIDRILEADEIRRTWRDGHRRTTPEWVVRLINPARTLRQLEKRGLIDRVSSRGGSSAALTDAGRAMVSE